MRINREKEEIHIEQSFTLDDGEEYKVRKHITKESSSNGLWDAIAAFLAFSLVGLILIGAVNLIYSGNNNGQIKTEQTTN